MARLTKEQHKEKEEFAKLLYVREGITNFILLEERTSVSQKTLRAWAKEGEWQKLKKNIILTRDEQMVLMYDELEELNNSIKNKPEGERFADNKEASIRRQLVKDIKDLETDASLPEIISSLTLFLNFVKFFSIDHTKLLARYVDDFLKEKLKK